jgi:hypothetical protein
MGGIKLLGVLQQQLEESVAVEEAEVALAAVGGGTGQDAQVDRPRARSSR